MLSTEDSTTLKMYAVLAAEDSLEVQDNTDDIYIVICRIYVTTWFKIMSTGRKYMT